MRLLRLQNGDTLVEVTFALAILSALLASAFTVANLSQRVVAAAKERTVAVSLAQEQVEALHAYRDKDLTTAGSPTLANAFGYSLTQCVIGPVPTFHMATGATNSGWRPISGATTNGLYTISFSACPSHSLLDRVISASTQEYEFTVSVTWASNLSGPNNSATVVARLADLQNFAPIDCSDAITVSSC